MHRLGSPFPTSAVAIGEGIVVDASNNIYVVGTFKDTPLAVGPSLTLLTAGGGDAFVVKYDGSTGSPIWAKR